MDNLYIALIAAFGSAVWLFALGCNELGTPQ